MSLLIAVVQGASAALLTDGATYNLDGTLTGIGSKVCTLPGITAAVGYEGRTCSDDIAAVAAELGVQSARDLVRNLGGIAAYLAEWNRRWFPTEPEPDVLLCAIVYDAPIGATAWLASSGGAIQREGLEPGKPRRTGAYFNYGDPGAALGRAVAMPDPASFDVVADGLRLAEFARNGAWDDAAPDAHFVGGFLEMTTVSAAGLQRQRLRAWPDRVGVKIAPARPLAQQAVAA